MAKAVKEEVAVVKSKAEEAMERLNKEFGKGTVAKGGFHGMHLPAVSTGSLQLDIAIGIGGFPYGRIVEIIGPESSGKTTICLHTIANAQKKGELCAIVDSEHALDGQYAEALGVDMDNVIISQPDYGEQALKVVKELILTGEVKVIMIDSVAAMTPKAEIEGNPGDQKPGLQARMMGQGLRMISGIAEKYGVLLLFTNQIREKIGVMFGSPETTTGGNAMKFYASVRLDMRRINNDKNDEVTRTKITVKKNKVGKPFKEVEVTLVWGKGFDRVTEVLDLAVELDIITKSGGSHTYEENRIAKSRDEAVQFLRDNEGLVKSLEQQIMTKIKGEVIEEPVVETA